MAANNLLAIVSNMKAKLKMLITKTSLLTMLTLILIGRFTVLYAQQENFKLLFHVMGETTDSELGKGMTPTGDWNHDGIGDIFVSVDPPEYGRQYYGGTEMDTIPDLFFYEGPAINFGMYSNWTEDINGDNWSDLSLTRFTAYSDPTIVYLYLGEANPDSLADMTFYSESNDMPAFGVYSSYGDVNGDGHNDFGVSDVNYGTPGTRGKIYIYYGGPDFDTIPDFTITGDFNNFGSSFGSSLSIAGDVNNDGYNDIFCMAGYTGYFEGGAYIFFGGTEPDSIPDWHIPEYHQGASLSIAVGAILQDVNGDDYDDIAVGRIVGDVLIFYGGETIATASDLILYNGDEDVQSAGDVNNDGYGDIITADYIWGGVHVFFGGDPMNPIPDLGFTAASLKVRCAGDVDGNGVDDFMYSIHSLLGEVYIWGDTTLTAVVQPDITSQPSTFQLFQNYPNPFNSSTEISYSIPKNCRIELRLFNIIGEEVAVIAEGYHQPGVYARKLDCAGLASGMYFLHLNSGDFREVKKIILLK